MSPLQTFSGGVSDEPSPERVISSPVSVVIGSDSTRSTSQSVQCVNPRRYSALHCGQNMVKRESTTPRNISTAVKHCAATQCALPLYFLLFAKSFETGRKLLYLNTLFVTQARMYLLVLYVVNSRPHLRPSSQSVSLLPLSLYVLTSLPNYPFLFTLLRTLWHAPKLNSFFFNGFRTLCPETPGVAVPTPSVKGFNASPPVCVFSAGSPVYQLE